MKTKLIASLIAVAGLAAACSTGSVASRAAASASPSTLASPTIDLTQSDISPAHSSTAQIINRALPSVVNVRVRALSSGVFGTQEGQAEGSGVIIDKDGTILTNNHVVSGALTVEVVFNDDHKKMTAQVIGTDPERDLAVIHVNAHDLTPITLGRSGNLQLGDSVIAIGFPLGLGGPTVTKGIVSGLDRTISVSREDGSREHLVGLLQTDAAINPGNSGGALIDSEGQLVGINTAAAQASSAENVGFSIAIDEALPVIKDILAHPAEDRAWLGVQVDDIKYSLSAERAGLDSDARGALIVNIFTNSAAEDAGLKEGDLITRVGSHDVASSDGLTAALGNYAPGDRVGVTVVRDGSTETLTVTLARRPPTLDQ